MPSPEAYSSLPVVRADAYGDPRRVIIDPKDVPANLPIVPLGDPGRGWREISVGEKVKTHYEFFSFAKPMGWRLSDFWTHEGEVNKGRTHYREPKSLRAWWHVAPALAAKWARRLFRKRSA